MAPFFNSSEPEIVMETGRALFSRLSPREEANLRYNGSRRLVTKKVNLQGVPTILRKSKELLTL